ncbi:glycine N-acyltransferase-like protein 3 [Acipenser oxyrinchus oxyrinchus]|uniref:Glycine N-acyltransferase-like protein n=1 Tax=Acipenser oxyrinchus oxyrinchus TaxID=40147 RepID=A0AAD8LNG8_ACIOX|nr:glycine N-acyltransferase-like protein 3 [Acipenser oxyrinchus oxyrinchus]
MLALGSEELRIAESALKEFFPQSIKVYGCLFNLNREKPHNLEVLVDSWPDFKTLICKPHSKSVRDREGVFNIYSVFSKDKDNLRELLEETGVVDWSAFTLFAGIEIGHVDMMKELAVSKNTPSKIGSVMHVMMLRDVKRLPQLPSESDASPRLSSLDESHAELVNKTWSFGGTEISYRSVKNYIQNFPNFCILDESGSPVAWILLYQHCALGLLYTLPECRRKGFARVLVTVMSKHLLSQGYPVYCFIEEGNEISYRLFQSLGFEEDPDYRAVWFELNCP